ncbi:MAG: hypothetical protein EWV75_04880 [Microcystis wesenbergii Mw_QC_S_20081001_S30D]|jgi:hypothetical protein|uniref:Uncharacterized protein n=1 Tax=Microcystis wesenbergii Mw_QC_S_20081001_S30D TaxID=2486245 RepID=A0A552JUV9_9CHRO|nr:hypothetical protein [Microcystis aeruginosa W11-03]NCR94682.1 hypothetical protein [Microcystis aeruginosa W11-06]TRU98132.1 MAG: hypothetical protein EWV73_15445 [Microcystis wesenbergii Mw_QC_B_20070930_S4D]TRU99552.1 MAG: hypothetical protein EWV75_04880 [Microcystis wesenbergii Mw_QC_S_20081001_S30D]TRV02727.1 MAG: hypothetical protein EWV74_08240 [Microcystis wesenbergii Mw_QC_S_20081001_S30]TRV16834.1 MAG: hypothetical protein EWV89_04235 [Microcystis wesenbergii Mw_QC_B_20070930_S4]
MNQSQLIHAAKQQDAAAIIALLNRSLLTRKIEVIAATSQENVLTLKVQSKRIPNQHKLLPFLSAEIKSLGIDGLEQVIVYGMTEESDIPAWQESITLSQDDLIVNHVTKLDSLPTITAEIAENNPEDVPEALEDSETTEEKALEKREEFTEAAENIVATGEGFSLSHRRQSSFPLSIILPYLGIGFGAGIIIGAYFGYQKAVSEMPAQPGAIEQPR